MFDIFRSAIKKIFEHDDTPAKSLVLCVSQIVSLPGGGKAGTNGTTTSPAKDGAMGHAVRSTAYHFEIGKSNLLPLIDFFLFKHIRIA